MSQEIRFKCSWNRCDSAATRHIRFGNRTFGVHDILPSPDQNYTVLHRNLCDGHSKEVRSQYLDTREYPLGECPACDRR